MLQHLADKYSAGIAKSFQLPQKWVMCVLFCPVLLLHFKLVKY